MLLPMVFEKLAKAAYTRSGFTIPKTHKVMTHLLAFLGRHTVGRQMLGASQNVVNFIRLLEEANPNLAGLYPQPCEQLEYPWEDPSTYTIFWPEQHLSLVRRVRDPKDRIALDCLRFASDLEKKLVVIIP